MTTAITGVHSDARPLAYVLYRRMTGFQYVIYRLIARLVGGVDDDGLELRVVQHRVRAHGPAEAAVLVAAPGRPDDPERPEPVDRDLARLHAAGQPDRAAHVAGPDRRVEAVFGPVGDRDGIILVVEAEHRQDRPEDLLLRDAHVGADPVEDRGLDKEPP